MENTKTTINKNRKLKIILCYFSLLVLIVLLLLPPALRMLVKEKKEPEVVKAVTILSCERDKESISSTFLNQDPQNILYKLKGNYTEDKQADEFLDELITGDEEKESNTIGNELFKKLKKYSDITYDDLEDVTSLSVMVSSLQELDDYELLFNNANNQEIYFKSLGFSCSKTTI